MCPEAQKALGDVLPAIQSFEQQAAAPGMGLEQEQEPNLYIAPGEQCTNSRTLRCRSLRPGVPAQSQHTCEYYYLPGFGIVF